MPAYVDSSIVLAILHGEPGASVAVRLWEAYGDRVSSRLLAAECLTVLRRAARARGGEAGDAWYGLARGHLQRFIEEVSLEDVSQDVMAVLEEQDGLGQCRTLDAVHLATAMLFRARCDRPDDLVVLTFDAAMAQTARAHGLLVLPPSS